MSAAALRHRLALQANLLLGYASRMWSRADRAVAHDRVWWDRCGNRYFAQACALIEYADALALDPKAAPTPAVAAMIA